jgi:hypothetical protein
MRSSGSDLETEINGHGVRPCSPRDIPLSTKVGIKIRRPVVVAQSVQFACRLKATEFVDILNALYQRSIALAERKF